LPIAQLPIAGGGLVRFGIWFVGGVAQVGVSGVGVGGAGGLG